MLKTLNTDGLHALSQNPKSGSEYRHEADTNYAQWEPQVMHSTFLSERACEQAIRTTEEDMNMDESFYDADDDDNESQGFGGLYDWDLFLEPLEQVDHQLSIKKRNVPSVDLVPNWTGESQENELLCNLISTELSTGNANARTADKMKHNLPTAVPRRNKLSRSQRNAMQRSEWDSSPIGSLGSGKRLANVGSAVSLPKPQTSFNPGECISNTAKVEATRKSMTHMDDSYSPVNKTMNLDFEQNHFNSRIQSTRQTSQTSNQTGSANNTEDFKNADKGLPSNQGGSQTPSQYRSGRTAYMPSKTRRSISTADEQETDDWIRQSLGPLAALRASSASPRSSPYPQAHTIKQQQVPKNNLHLQQMYNINSTTSRAVNTHRSKMSQSQQQQKAQIVSPSSYTPHLAAAPSPSSSVSAQIVQPGQKIDRKMRMFIDNMLSTAHPQSEALPPPPRKPSPMKKVQPNVSDSKMQNQSSREGRSLSITDAKSAITNLTTRSQHNASKWTIETLKHFFCRDFVEVSSSLTTPVFTRQLETREKELLRFMTEMSVNSVVGNSSTVSRPADPDAADGTDSAENGLTRLTEVGPVREPEVTYVINTLLTFVASRAGVQVIPERKFERRSARDAKNLPGCIIDYAITKNGVVLGLVECKSKREFRKDAFGHMVAELLVLQDRAGTPDVPIFGILTDGFRWVFAVVKGTELHLEHEYNNGSVIKVRRALRWKDLNQITEDMTALIGESTRVFDEIVRLGAHK
ncbi:hypothetical protein SARC_11073 [Sphaeroforma arctica JP610]|uniref:Uncharacterized protein n=1 Tax=Sphaeroforma arctica JP610 TaxID=667725 RepID=A0A0L0FK61_9EUKA|nr:hypothetical protein SARC_11073 [Sphaeroforma arctica JP610]KNC76428.1 hypothetical protein SARC_11073 [Sphaeroforma arctica JP610]|eukprot:XP_014150330.1 hypothetical protein SARC_11073 [Sphaeroforma arctica JP610]